MGIDIPESLKRTFLKYNKCLTSQTSNSRFQSTVSPIWMIFTPNKSSDRAASFWIGPSPLKRPKSVFYPGKTPRGQRRMGRRRGLWGGGHFLVVMFFQKHNFSNLLGMVWDRFGVVLGVSGRPSRPSPTSKNVFFAEICNLQFFVYIPPPGAQSHFLNFVPLYISSEFLKPIASYTISPPY